MRRRRHVSQLRKALGAERIQTRAPGYVLRLQPDELDAARFEALLAEGRPGEALALWPGPALADFQYEPWAQSAVGRLEEARLTAVEQRVEAELGQGRHSSSFRSWRRWCASSPCASSRGHS